MTMKRQQILPEDIIEPHVFLRLRESSRSEMIALKRERRVAVGEFIMLHFENFLTLWWQIHEMLRIEQGGAAQIEDELAAYNPLVPQQNEGAQELVATMMIEIDDPVLRQATLQKLTHIETCISLRFGEHVIVATAEDSDTERTRECGKTSAVHFLRWTFSSPQVAAFSKPHTEVLVEVAHPAYAAKTVLSESTRLALAADFRRSSGQARR